MPDNNDEKIVTVEEIQALRAEISLMHQSLATDVVGHSPLISKVVDRFLDKGLKKEWLEKLLAPLVGASFEDDEALLVAYVLEELDLLLKVKEEVKLEDKKVHIIIGGTGIGKTSLVGKLAARYTYFLKDSYNVALVNFDSYKVGAVEQLNHYADAMDIPMIELEGLFESDHDLVLLDTAGNIGHDIENLRNLIAIIENDTLYRIEISLALSATAKTRDLERILIAFNDFKIENIMLTKLDETCDLADLMNFLIRIELPVSYISTGQEIPEDLIVGSKEYLLNQFMKDE